jgi:hypothetical protein
LTARVVDSDGAAAFTVAAVNPETQSGRMVAALRRHAVWIIALLAVVASISGIRNGFALDDVHIIVENGRVHSLVHAWQLFGQTYWPPVEGASLYRPLTMLLFATEWVIGNGSPLPFHVMNIVLYAGVCVALYRLLREIANGDVALIASALFAVHPVHTEAVANVVGQAELLVAIALFLSVERYIKARRSGNPGWRDIATISALFLGGCLAKEHAIILPGLLASSEILINRGQESLFVRIKRMAPTFVSLALVAIAFVAVRAVVTGGFRGGSNELFGYEAYYSRVLTMLTIVIEWLRLFFWPAQLSSDYSYPRTRIATVPDVDMLPGVLVILGCALIAWRVRRSNPVVTFAFVWIAVTLAIPSNLLIVTGFVLAERTLFLASAGVTLMVAVGVVQLWNSVEGGSPVVRRGTVAALGLLLVCGTWRSATRSPVWRDNETLFHQTVEDVPFSSRAHWMLAEYLLDEGRPREGVDDMMIAIRLARKDNGVIVAFGADLLQSADMCGRATPLYKRAMGLKPKDEQLRTNASLCLIKLGRVGEARSIARAGLSKGSATPKLDWVISFADSLELAHRQTKVTKAGL